MVGGVDYVKSNFNRTTMALRQPGSSFKPFVFFKAIDNGIPPNTLIQDVETEFIDNWTYQIWSPKNYNNRYHGPSTMFRALTFSYNVVAAKLLERVGIKEVINLTKSLGITSKLDEVLSLSLGSSAVTLYEMMQAYSVFANLGIKVEPIFITKILDSNNRVIYEPLMQSKNLLNENSVFVINKMLERVILLGTGSAARVENYQIMGKTGTTNDCTDVWFCGFSPALTTIVYVGNDIPKPLGNKYTGGSVSASIFSDYMKKVLPNYPNTKFEPPDGVVVKKICKESGLLHSKYCPDNSASWIYFLKNTEPDLYCDFHEDFNFNIDDSKLFDFSFEDELNEFNENKNSNLEKGFFE
jgi:penicillin-binding protein 1A